MERLESNAEQWSGGNSKQIAGGERALAGQGNNLPSFGNEMFGFGEIFNGEIMLIR